MFTCRPFICDLIRGEEAAYVYACDSNWANFSVALGSFIYAPGGKMAGSDGPTERYDSVTDTWTRLGDLGFEFYNGAVAVFDGEIWACGGAGRNGECQILNTATNSWIAASTMNEPRSVILYSKSPHFITLCMDAQFSDNSSVWQQ